MNVCVTGATGFVGAHVVRALCERGDEVKVTYRDPKGALSAQGYTLMAQDWRFSTAKARRTLGYRTRPLDQTLRATIDWYRELIERRAFERAKRSSLSTLATSTQLLSRLGVLEPLKLGQRVAGRRVIAGV